MNCPSCGSALKIDSGKEILYCPYCGAELPDDRVRINHNYNESHIYKNVNVNNTKKEIDWTTIFIVGSLPAFVIVLLIILAIAGKL